MLLVQDSREQCPLDFSRYPDVEVEVSGLRAGDYSLNGLESRFAIERKSIADLVSSVTQGRDRFTREMELLRGYDLAVIVVEGTMAEVAHGQYRSKANPNSVLQTLTAWHVRYGVPTLWAGCPRDAAYMVRALARHYLRQAEKMARAVLTASGRAQGATNAIR